VTPEQRFRNILRTNRGVKSKTIFRTGSEIVY
jgi:hypothetical protein